MDFSRSKSESKHMGMCLKRARETVITDHNHFLNRGMPLKRKKTKRGMPPRFTCSCPCLLFFSLKKNKSKRKRCRLVAPAEKFNSVFSYMSTLYKTERISRREILNTLKYFAEDTHFFLNFQNTLSPIFLSSPFFSSPSLFLSLSPIAGLCPKALRPLPLPLFLSSSLPLARRRSPHLPSLCNAPIQNTEITAKASEFGELLPGKFKNFQDHSP